MKNNNSNYFPTNSNFQQIQNHISKNNNNNNNSNSKTSISNNNTRATSFSVQNNNNFINRNSNIIVNSQNFDNNSNRKMSHQYQNNNNNFHKQNSLNDNGNNRQLKSQLHHQQSLQEHFYNTNNNNHSHHQINASQFNINGSFNHHLFVQTANSAPQIFQIKHPQHHFPHSNPHVQHKQLMQHNNMIHHHAPQPSLSSLPQQQNHIMTISQPSQTFILSSSLPNTNISSGVVQQTLIQPNMTIIENVSSSSSSISPNSSTKSNNTDSFSSSSSSETRQSVVSFSNNEQINTLSENEPLNNHTKNNDKTNLALSSNNIESDLVIRKSSSISSSDYSPSQYTSPLTSPSPFFNSITASSKEEEQNKEETDGEKEDVVADQLPNEKDYADKNDFLQAIDHYYMNTKWPLYETWTFWHFKNDSTQSWESNLKEIIDIAYVEDFWSVINNLYTMNNYMQQGDVMFFKKGIRPMWEDKHNKNGGSWLHQFNNYNKKNPEIYDYWLDTLLSLIGDNFCGRNPSTLEQECGNDESEHICDYISGVYSCHRGKAHKLSLWTKNYKDEKNTRLIGKLWKWLLKINENVTITFEAHETKNNKNTTFKIVYKE